MIKNLFIYWGQGFDNAPIIVKKCLLSWKIKNPNWKIIELDDNNLSEYINIVDEIQYINNKNITKTSYSDIVRIFLLEKYGGCWCDATTFCNLPLDDWLENVIQHGFFAFDLKDMCNDRLLSSWFLYGEKDNYIVKKWKEETVKYWKNNDMMYNYFWFHYLFGDLYKMNDIFKKIWDNIPKISAYLPHYLQIKGLLKPISDDIKNHITDKKCSVFKLTYKYDETQNNDRTILSYILNLEL